MSRKNMMVSLAAIGILALAPASAAQTIEEQPPDNFRFTRDRTDRMTVPILISGSGPYDFLVDTGSERTVISRELATQLRLAPGRSAMMHSMSGAGTVQTVVIPRLDLSRKAVKDIHAPALEQTHLGGDGLLGVDGLQAQRVLFDFKNGMISVTPATRREVRTDKDEIVITARSRFGRLILADARIEGEKLWVVVDTGSQVSIGNEALRRRLEKKRRLRLPMGRIDLTSVTGDRIVADYTIASGLEMGGLKMTDMPLAFAEVHPFEKLGLKDRPAMLLGMDALRAFGRVSMDFLNRTVRFNLPDARVESPVRFAGTGLRIGVQSP